MKVTRSKKASAKSQDEPASSTPSTTIRSLEAKVANPPHLFILPKDASADARIITIDHESDDKSGEAAPRRYFVCPTKGFYEFTKVSAPKRACRSWLLAPELSTISVDEQKEDKKADVSQDENSKTGYVLSSPDFLIATPIDPLFILLSVSGVLWSPEMPDRPEYLDLDDRLRTLKTQAPHLRQMLEDGSGTALVTLLKEPMISCCKALKMGGGGSDDGEEEPEVLYTTDLTALAAVLFKKATKMVDLGLPASMEEKFVTQALEVPVQSIRREESDMSTATENKDPADDGEKSSAETVEQSQEKDSKDTTHDDNITRLLRLRTALDYMLKSYVRAKLHAELNKIYKKATNGIVDFEPLNTRLAHIAKLKKDAHALRSISDNVSRKRSAMDDEEAMEKQEAKRRKKEEEDLKKKNTSLGIKKLMKADTSGMKKMSAFFSTVPAKKAN